METVEGITQFPHKIVKYYREQLKRCYKTLKFDSRNCFDSDITGRAREREKEGIVCLQSRWGSLEEFPWGAHSSPRLRQTWFAKKRI